MCALLDTVRFGGNSTPSGRLTAMAQLRRNRPFLDREIAGWFGLKPIFAIPLPEATFTAR